MSQWADFENLATKYLNDNFGDVAEFYLEGGSNSNVPDIRVECFNGETFYIEAKNAPAQCGQFVLLPDVITSSFVFSHRNDTVLIPSAQRIIEYMNLDFEAYKEAGTAGKEIDLGDNGNTFAEWIVTTYKNKGVRYFITNDFTILPVEEFHNHFNVSATYRVKRSGSSSVGVSKLKEVSKHIRDLDYPVEGFKIEGDKLFFYSSHNLHNQRFVFKGYEYMFSKRDNRFEIRRLSNTFNANVIFSIEKKLAKGLSNDEFKSQLK